MKTLARKTKDQRITNGRAYGIRLSDGNAFSDNRFFLSLFLFFISCSFLVSCASTRAPVPVGVVPAQNHLAAEDEDYGHKVLGVLTRQYPLDRDDGRISRVRTIVGSLTRAGNVDHNPWHAYVLQGDNVKNAAATRGNFLFVWTGMLRSVKNDDELATIIAHEIAHVLAGHTNPDPGEEANRILSDIAGVATREAILYQGGTVAIWAGLAQMVVSEGIKAFILNPELQRIELEADQIGLFLMADAGYDPAYAVQFWERVQKDPSFAGAPAEFLSSHPSSATRLARLKELLPEATLRYRAATGRSYAPARSIAEPQRTAATTTRELYETSPPLLRQPSNRRIWVVQEEQYLFREPSRSSSTVTRLSPGTRVEVKNLEGRWLHISEPFQGFIESRYLSPQSENDF